MRTGFKGLLAAGAVGALVCVGGVSPAYATTDGTYTSCSHLDETLCLYYYTDLEGSHIGIYGEVDNYAIITWACPSDGCPEYHFVTSGTGYGTHVKNNAESVYNENTATYYVYFNSNQQGSTDKWDPYGYGTWYGNLNHTYNNNASQDCACPSG